MKSSDFRKEARTKLTGKWDKLVIMTFIYTLIFFAFGFIEGLLGKETTASYIIEIILVVIQIPLSFGIIMAFLKLYRSEEAAPFDFISLGFENFKRAWGVAWHVFLKLIVPILLILIIIIAFTVSIVMNKAYYLASVSRASSQQFITANPSLLDDLHASEYEANRFNAFYSSLFSSGISLVCSIAILVVSIWLTCKSYYYSLAYIIAADEPELTTKEAVEKSKELMTGKRGKLFILQLSFIGWFFLIGLVVGVVSLLGGHILPSIVEMIGIIFLVPYIEFAVFSFYENLQTSKPIEAEVDKPQQDDPIQGN